MVSAFYFPAPPSCIGQSIISHARNIYANLLHSCSWIGRKPPLRRLVVFQTNSTVFPLKLSWLLIVAQQRISLPPSPHDAAGYEGQIWRASFGAVRGQNWGNQKQHRLTTQQFIDTNTAKQKEPAQNITLWAGFLVPVAGIEPARHRWQWILSPPRLPVPTHRRAKRPPISGLHKLLYRINRKKAIEKRNFFGEKLARKWCRNSPLFMLKCKLNLCGIVSVVPPMPFCLSKSEST